MNAVLNSPMDTNTRDQSSLLERYLAGTLQPKEAREAEQQVAQNPLLVEQTGLADRVARAVALLDAAGRGGDWHEQPRRPWENPLVGLAFAAISLVLGITAAVLFSRLEAARARITALTEQVAVRPVDAAASRRAIAVALNPAGPPAAPAFALGARAAEMGDLQIDVSAWRQPTFRVTLERVDQGSIATLYGLMKDSNGQIRVALNSGALGPGNYTVAVEGVAWNGATAPVGGTTFAVIRGR